MVDTSTILYEGLFGEREKKRSKNGDNICHRLSAESLVYVLLAGIRVSGKIPWKPYGKCLGCPLNTLTFTGYG